MASTIRTFVAVDLADQPRAAVRRILSTLDESISGYRWVHGDRLHLTLKFLGDVAESAVPDVCRSVAQAAASHPPFQMTLGTLGAFPSIDRPRILWLGVTGGAEKLVALHGSLEKQLVPVGFDADRGEFHPHVTLGRIRRHQRMHAETSTFIASHKNLVAGETDVREVVVYASYLDREGPTYTPMARCPLGSE